MAGFVLSAAADQIFALLKEQAGYHVNLVRGAEEEVVKLGQELNTIRNVLEDAENRRFQDKNINTWLWKLRQTSYEMEDILDEWKYALLKLHNGERSPDDDAAPPKKKELRFDLCRKWKEWEDITAEEEESPAFQVMPCLTMLRIRSCLGLTALPHRLLRKARSLEMLDITGSSGLQRYMNLEGTDWKSISLNNPRLQLRERWL